MTALLLTLLTQAPVQAHLERTGPGCYRATDDGSGWRQAALPAEAPALAAPPPVEQYRSGEPALVTIAHDVFDHAQSRPRRGVSAVTFDLPQGTSRLEVRFAQRLDGMRVEVLGGDGAGRTAPLQPERRYVGEELALQWDARGVQTVTLVLHHHLRQVPVVAQWSSAHWATAPTESPARLYYRQPAGRPVELCHAPGARLGLRWAPDARGRW